VGFLKRLTALARLRLRAGAGVTLFLSHAAIDRKLAEHVRQTLLAAMPGLRVFLASKPGHIEAARPWFQEILSELESADLYVVLLTPQSVDRPWIAFESGAAWMSDRKLVLATAGGLVKASIPWPLGGLQALALDDAEDAEHAFRSLGVRLPEPKAFAAEMVALGRQTTVEAAHLAGWIGVELGDRFFAWDGPMFELKEDTPVPSSASITDAIREAGHEPVFGVPQDRLSAIAGGWKQVFETDRLRWRRQVVGGGGGQFLYVRPPKKPRA